MKYDTPDSTRFAIRFLMALNVMLAVFACNLPVIEDGGLVPTGLKAEFTAAPQSGDAPLTVLITNTSENAASYFWTFGDGATSVAENPGSHLYTTPGNFELRLIVTDDKNNKDTAFVTISVAQAGATPVAGFSMANNGCTGPCTVQFTNTSSNGNSFVWDFGDPASGADNASTATSPSHFYAAEGTYTVKLKATNGAKADSISQIVTITGIKFEKTFTGYGGGAKASQLSDGGYIVAGTLNSNAFLIRLDPNGTVLNQRTYTGYDANVQDVAQLSDGTFAVVGSSFNPSVQNSDFFYLRTSANLEPLTGPVRIGENDGSEEALDILELSDGSILITGYSFVTATQNTDVYAVRYSPGLTTSYFKKRYTAPDHELGYAAIEVSDGYIITGSSYGDASPSNALFLKLETNGNKAASYPRFIGTSGDTELAVAVAKANATELMLGGQYVGMSGTRKVWLQKTSLTGSSSGSPITFGTSQDVYCQDMIATRDGGFAVAGNDNLDAYLAKVNANGTQTIDKTFVANGPDAFQSIEETSDGGFILCGYKNNVLYVVKTDPSGKSN